MRYQTIVVVLLVGLAAAPAAHAVVTFDQLGKDLFTVQHYVKWIGSRGTAVNVVYEKASSLCIAAGYTHMKILHEDATAGGEYEDPSASLRVQFLHHAGTDVVDCKVKATDDYIKQCKKRLSRIGYEGPVVASEQTAEVAGAGNCSVQQIMAMTSTGMSQDQIEAACGGN